MGVWASVGVRKLEWIRPRVIFDDGERLEFLIPKRTNFCALVIPILHSATEVNLD